MSASAEWRHVVVCADDFGGSPRGDAAILQLADIGAISAVSVFADGDPADESMPELRKLPPAVSIGLHFNLTEPLHGASARPLRAHLVGAYITGTIGTRWIGEELERQCNHFEQRIGRSPDFIDGHQHVHQFKRIRDCLLSVVRMRYGSAIAIRTTRPRAWRGTKAALIAVLGGHALASELSSAGDAANQDFAGVYDFSHRVPFGARMARWLADIGDHGLIMCHPQWPTKRGVPGAREAEFEFLSSSAWPQLRQAHKISLVPFGSPFPP